MLLQTNSYVVPREKRVEHARLLRRFRQALVRLGCDHFEVYEQVGANWNSGDNTNRFVQIMRFRDRKHQLAVQSAERSDPTAQALLREFCELINFPYQQQQGLFAAGYYTSFLRMPGQQHGMGLADGSESESPPALPHTEEHTEEHEDEAAAAEDSADAQDNAETAHPAEHEPEGSNGGVRFAPAEEGEMHDSRDLGPIPDSEAGTIGPADDDETDDAQPENRTTSSNS